MIWHLIVDVVGKTGPVNMALDQSLLDAAQKGAGYLRLYRWNPPCLSFGRNEPARRRYDAELITQRGLAVVRRPTGGRAVWHEHEVTYAVAAPLETFGSLSDTYTEIHATVSRALARLGALVDQASPGSSSSLGSGSCFATAAGGEIVARGAKLVGSAQLREGQAFLQHGSILLQDGQNLISEITRQTTTPVNATSLSNVLGRPISFEETCKVIVEEARASWEGNWLPTRGSTGPATRFNFDDSAWTWRR